MNIGEKFRFKESSVIMVILSISDDYVTLSVAGSSGDLRTISIDQLNYRELINIQTPQNHT